MDCSWTFLDIACLMRRDIFPDDLDPTLKASDNLERSEEPTGGYTWLDEDQTLLQISLNYADSSSKCYPSTHIYIMKRAFRYQLANLHCSLTLGILCSCDIVREHLSQAPPVKVLASLGTCSPFASASQPFLSLHPILPSESL